MLFWGSRNCMYAWSRISEVLQICFWTLLWRVNIDFYLSEKSLNWQLLAYSSFTWKSVLGLVNILARTITCFFVDAQLIQLKSFSEYHHFVVHRSTSWSYNLTSPPTHKKAQESCVFLCADGDVWLLLQLVIRCTAILTKWFEFY